MSTCRCSYERLSNQTKRNTYERHFVSSWQCSISQDFGYSDWLLLITFPILLIWLSSTPVWDKTVDWEPESQCWWYHIFWWWHFQQRYEQSSLNNQMEFYLERINAFINKSQNKCMQNLTVLTSRLYSVSWKFSVKLCMLWKCFSWCINDAAIMLVSVTEKEVRLIK